MNNKKENTNKNEKVIEKASEILTEITKEELAEKLAKCEAERDEYLSGWRRTKADYTNYKQEEMRRLEEVAKYGSEELIKDILGVMESFDRALLATEDTKAKDGLERIKNQFLEILKRRGLQKIEIKIGDKFDPQCHEVLLQEEGGGVPDTIIEELSAGYTLHGKVIQTSKVKINK